MRLRLSLLSALLLGPCAFGQSPAQTSPGQATSAQAASPTDNGKPTVFRANAREVVVDVVVTNGDSPVAALGKQNFQVLEDGKPQTIDFFEEHTAKTLPVGTSISLPKMPPNVYTNTPPAPESDSVNVLLIDMLNTERQDQIYVRHQILTFLHGMKPGTRTAIFTLGSSLTYIQGFTSDTSTLLAAINGKKGGSPPERDASSHSRSDYQDDAEMVQFMMKEIGGTDEGVAALIGAQKSLGDMQYGDRIAMTLEALDHIARYLAEVPGRKNLLWFAGTYPMTVFPSALQAQGMNDMRVYSKQVKKTADLLTLSRVAVYPINAQGMMNDQSMEADSAAGGKGATLMQNVNGATENRAEIISNMEQLASDTGGKAYYNTNDLNGAMQRAISDGSHYYTVIYSPINKKMDGQYRHITVKLSDSKGKLSYRRGYNADDPSTANAATPPANPLRSLMVHGLPDSTQLLYAARVLPSVPQPAPDAKRAGKNPKLIGPTTRYTVDLFIRWTDVKLTPAADGSHSGRIQVELLAYDRGGNAVNWAGGTQAMTLTPDIYAAIQRSGVPAHFQIDLPSNEPVYLATGVYDLETGKAGTMEIPLAAAANATVTAQSSPPPN